ncbi:hypothetical protein NDU88_007391 [Pleurodeles waltl]|uniref:Uncharacterized protein n=1 Tax=Pleurodeles waltl TaxID=8319 RepID=A0AAV7RUQ1_PLEWA|nr:hypothetical protein NDU88_007391 [Pleurodeles waltl]
MPTALFSCQSSGYSKKGLDRSWRGCQDKLLDVSGPLTKILDLAIQSKETNTHLDPEVVLEWAQRAICLLGNANCAMSTERRRSFLIRLDLKLAELATNEAGSLANGMLFGDRYVKDLGKYVANFTALDKAQSNIKKVFNNALFARAGHFRGRAPGRRFQASGFASQRSKYQTFYPNRYRGVATLTSGLYLRPGSLRLRLLTRKLYKHLYDRTQHLAERNQNFVLRKCMDRRRVWLLLRPRTAS